MNQWEAFNEYQEEQRQQRLAKEQAIAEELQAKQNEAIALLRERGKDIQVLKEQATEHQQALKTIQEKLDPIQQLTEKLKEDNQQRQKVIERFQERQHINKKEYTTSPLEIDFYRASPLEVEFYRAWIIIDHEMPILKPQYQIGRFRVDFAHVESMTVVEIDGHDYHSSRHSRNNDYSRQHEIENLGWYFIRFTGSQVFNDAHSCAQMVYERIMARLG